MPLPSFIEQRFPVIVQGLGTVGGPIWRTAISERRNGTEQRNIDLDDPRREWSVGDLGVSEVDLKTLIDFHSMVRGAAIGFRYLDQSDWSGTSQLLGVGDGTTKIFQLVKRYGTVAYEYVRRITKPVSGSVTVKVNNVLQGSGWTIDNATGLITFTTAPGAGLQVTASYQFDVPVRFKEDRIRHRLETFTHDGSRWFTLQSVTLIEIR